MKNLKVSAKLIVSFIMVSVLTLIVGIVGVVGMNRIDRMSEEMYELQTVPLPSLGKSIEMLQRQRANMREYIIGAALDDMEIITNAHARVLEQRAVMDEELPKYRATIRSDEAMKLFDEAVNLYNTSFTSAMDKIYAGAMNGEDARALEEIMRTYTNDTNKIVDDFDKCLTMKVETAAGAAKSANATARALLFVIIFVTVGAIAASLILAKILSGMIVPPLVALAGFFKQAGTKGDLSVSSQNRSIYNRYKQHHDEIGQMITDSDFFIEHIVRAAQTLEQVAKGDLTVDVNVLSQADTIGKSLKEVTNNLNNMFVEINSASHQVTMGSTQIADGAQALASGATEQAATLQQISASISDISSKTRENADRTSSASSLAGTIMQNAEKGSRQMEQMINAVNEINQANQNISRVIKAIDDIAFQTNILALNAAVEAARAGAAGKGFAVVAEEVRNLAAKSAESAKDTGGLIANSMEKAQLGTQIAGETAASLSEIVAGIDESAKIMSEIAQSSEEQSGAISQINIAIDGVTQVVQQNSATAEESAAASEEMNGQASVLESLISRFKLR